MSSSGGEDWNEGDASSHSSSEWEEDEEEASLRQRSLLWLCREGQIRFAREKFDNLINENKQDQLRREIFQCGRGDRNYALHELLMGGTSDRNAYRLTLQLLQFSKEFAEEHRSMLIMQPPSHKRTALHWAAWSNSSMGVMEPLLQGNPEALALKDEAGRTPLEIYHYYFCSRRNNHTPNPDDPRLKYLERMTHSWTQHRLRLTVHKCLVRYFVTQALTPFDKKHRKETSLTPRPWFVLSVLGTLIQSEMKPLVHRILQYVGGKAKLASAKSRSKKRRKNQPEGGTKKRGNLVASA